MRYIFLFLCFFMMSLAADQDILMDTYQEGGVLAELKRHDKYNPDGYVFGDDIYVVNKNPFPIEVSAKLADGINVKDGLIAETQVINSNSQGYLGWVTFESKNKDSSWNVSWSVKKHVVKAKH